MEDMRENMLYRFNTFITFATLFFIIQEHSKVYHVFTEISCHEGCIYLVKNTVKQSYCEILLLFKIIGLYFRIFGIVAVFSVT